MAHFKEWFTIKNIFVGEGTRKGNGACQCDRGYSGEICDNCGIGFYKADDSDTKKELKCLTCHKACLDQCTGPEPKQCLACRKGYLLNTEFGCLDIDECSEATNSKQALCHENEFCVNTEGSYKCSKVSTIFILHAPKYYLLNDVLKQFHIVF